MEIQKGTSDCPHAHMERRPITAGFFKRTFAGEADVCPDCGLTLWTDATQQRFRDWIVQLKHERRDTFQVQFYIPRQAREGLDEFLARFPGVPRSVLMRALTTVFLSAHTRIADFQNQSRQLIERSSYRLVAEGPRRKTSVQFSPMALLEVQTWAGILKLPPHKIVEDAIFKCLALSNEPDPRLRGLWERDILPQLEFVLRAV